MKTEQELFDLALEKFCTPHGSPNPETYAFIEGLKTYEQSILPEVLKEKLQVAKEAIQTEVKRSHEYEVYCKGLENRIKELTGEEEDIYDAVRHKRNREKLVSDKITELTYELSQLQSKMEEEKKYRTVVEQLEKPRMDETREQWEARLVEIDRFKGHVGLEQIDYLKSSTPSTESGNLNKQ